MKVLDGFVILPETLAATEPFFPVRGGATINARSLTERGEQTRRSVSSTAAGLFRASTMTLG